MRSDLGVSYLAMLDTCSIQAPRVENDSLHSAGRSGFGSIYNHETGWTLERVSQSFVHPTPESMEHGFVD
jgi:hypothetical protein